MQECEPAHVLSQKAETVQGSQEDPGSLLADHQPTCHALQSGVLLWQLQESRHGATGQGCKDSGKDGGG